MNRILPEPLGQDWRKHPKIKAGYLVMPDLHVPLHDPSWIKAITKRAHKEGVQNLLIGGDFFDFKNIGRHGRSPGYDTTAEVKTGKQVADWLLGEFARVDIILGNHDTRISTKTDSDLSTAEFLSLVFKDAAKVYDHHHCQVGKSWMVMHPKAYSPTANTAEKFAPNYPDFNIAVAHTHKWTMGRDRSGRRWMIEMGMCSMPGYFAYNQIEKSAYPEHQQGALIITKDERPIPLHPELT